MIGGAAVAYEEVVLSVAPQHRKRRRVEVFERGAAARAGKTVAIRAKCLRDDDGRGIERVGQLFFTFSTTAVQAFAAVHNSFLYALPLHILRPIIPLHHLTALPPLCIT